MSNVLDHRTRIKICGLTREQDVDAAVEAGADAVGFVLYPASPRYVTAARAAALARRLPPFVTPVLLLVNEPLEGVRAACAEVPHALLQFHGDETPAECDAAGRPYLRAARVPLDASTPFDLLKFASDFAQAQALLLDAHVEGYGGGGKAFHWSRLPPSVSCHAVLSGGLTPANVGDGIVQVRPRFRTLAVDVSSGVEASATGGALQKGVKDPAKIHQFVAAVRAADGLLARSTHALLSST
jgi:phosphoribosylanthranilate isomerase